MIWPSLKNFFDVLWKKIWGYLKKKLYSYRFIFVLKLSLKSLFYLLGLTVEGHFIKWRVIFKDQLIWNIFQRLLTEYLWIWLEISTLHNSSWLWWTVYKWKSLQPFQMFLLVINKKYWFLQSAKKLTSWEAQFGCFVANKSTLNFAY